MPDRNPTLEKKYYLFYVNKAPLRTKYEGRSNVVYSIPRASVFSHGCVFLLSKFKGT